MIPPGHMQKVNRSRPPARTLRLYSAAPSARVVGEGPVAGDVHGLLRLLDPHAELERLGLQRDATPEEHPVGVPRAVADRQDGQVGRDVARAGHQALELAVGDLDVLDPAGEPDLAAHRLELAAEGPHDQGEPVRAEVRLGLVDDRGLAVAVGQDLEDLEHVGAGVPAGELAVAEGAGAPLAEQVVALGVEHAAAVEPADVGDPILHVAAPLEDQGREPLEGQHVAGEEPGRPGADDHRAMFERVRAGLGPVEPLGLEPLDPRARGLQRGPVAGDVDLGRVDEVEVVVPPGVEALAQDPVGRDRALRPRRPGDRPASRGGTARARRVRGGRWRLSRTWTFDFDPSDSGAGSAGAGQASTGRPGRSRRG